MKKLGGILLIVIVCQASYGTTLTAQTGVWDTTPAALIRDLKQGHYVKVEQSSVGNTGIYICTGGGYTISLRDTEYTELSATIPTGTTMTCQTTGLRIGYQVNMSIKMLTAPDGTSEGWPYQSGWKASIPETTCSAEVPPAINLGDLGKSSTTTVVIPLDLPSGSIRFESADITRSTLMLGGDPSITLTPGDGAVAGDLAWSINSSNPSMVVTTTGATPGVYSSTATLTLSCQ